MEREAPQQEVQVLFVGADGHKNTSQITVMDAAGKILKRQRILSTPEHFRQSLAEFSEPLKAVLAASYCWGPMYDWLDDLTDEVVLAHLSKVRAIAEAKIKTDKIDSEILANLLRADLVPRAYAPSKDVRAVKRVLRQRLFLVQLRTMVKNRIRALLTQHSIELPKLRDIFGKSGLTCLQQVKLPRPDDCILREDLELLRIFAEKIASTEQLIEQLATGDEAVPWLASLPGIGKFLSVVIRWEVDDINRFQEANRFASYTGLVPSTYASASRTVHGRLTKRGNKWLRWAFIEAVTPAVRTSASLRAQYQRIQDSPRSKRRAYRDRKEAGRTCVDSLD